MNRYLHTNVDKLCFCLQPDRLCLSWHGYTRGNRACREQKRWNMSRSSSKHLKQSRFGGFKLLTECEHSIPAPFSEVARTVTNKQRMEEEVQPGYICWLHWKVQNISYCPQRPSHWTNVFTDQKGETNSCYSPSKLSLSLPRANFLAMHLFFLHKRQWNV